MVTSMDTKSHAPVRVRENLTTARAKVRAALAAFVLAGLAPGSYGQDEYFWEFPVSGNWSAPLLWDPDGLPGSVDAATIRVPGAYTVTVDSAPFVRGFALDNPDALVELNGVEHSMTVGADTPDAGSYVLGGEVWLRAGAGWFTPGPVIVDGPQSLIRMGTATRIEANRLVIRNEGMVLADNDTATIALTGLNPVVTMEGGSIAVSDGQRVNLAFDAAVNGPGEFDVGGGGILGVGNVTLYRVNLNLGNNLSEVRALASGNRLTIDEAIIAGGGSIGSDTLALSVGEHGAVYADAGRTLTLNTIDASDGLRNEGTLAAIGGGTLRLLECDVNNSSGTIHAYPASLVTFQNSPMTVRGGYLYGEGSGQVLVPASTEYVRFEDVVFAGNCAFEAGAKVHVAGAIGLDDTLAVGDGALVDFVDGTTFSGPGALELFGGSGTALDGVDDSARVINQGTIRGSGTFADVGAFTNQHVIEANHAQTFTVHLSDDDCVNEGVLRATDGGTLRLNAGVLENEGGVVEAVSGGVVALDSNAGVSHGTLRTDASGLIYDDVSSGQSVLTNVKLEGEYLIPTGQITRINGSFENLGRVRIEASEAVLTTLMAGDGASLVGGGTIELAGSTGFNRIIGNTADATLVNVDNTIRGKGHVCNNAMSLINQGTIIAEGMFIDPTNSGVFRNDGLIQVRAGSSNALDIRNGPFEQLGRVEIDAGSRLQRSHSTSDYVQTAGSTVVEGELLLQAGRRVDVAGGSLSGGGIINADVRNSGGRVSPGSSVGVLRANRAFTQLVGGVLEIEVEGVAEGASDTLAVSGAASLAGTLRLVAVDGYVPRQGETITVLTAGAPSGQFDDVELTGFPNGCTAVVRYEAARVRVTFRRAYAPVDPVEIHP